jgi:protein gp37
MAAQTGIEWTDETWNPVVGCSVISPGCTNCYAMRMAARIEAMDAKLGHAPHYRGLTRKTKAGAVWTGTVRVAPDGVLLAPLSWRKPRRVFVNSMSDVFHEALSDEDIDRVFAVMALAPRCTFQVLTKRADRMHAYFGAKDMIARLNGRIWSTLGTPRGSKVHHGGHWRASLPLPNVWLGVSAEDRRRASERVPQLQATPAARRMISVEPMLEEIEPALLGLRHAPRPDWIIVGGESGPGARAFWAPWARPIVRACKAAGVAVFVKQMGSNVQDRNDAGFEGCSPMEWHLEDELAQVEHDVDGYSTDYQGAPVRIRLRDRKGGDMAEWPEDLRVREFPA